MKIKIEKVYNAIFFISYFFLLLYSFIGANNNLHEILSKLSNISLILVVFSFFFQIKKYNKKDLLILLLITFSAGVLLFISKDYLFIKLILLMVLTNKISFDSRIKIDLIIRIVLFLIVYILYKSNYINDITYVTNQGTIRHSYGFTNPNVFSLHVLILCFEIIYLNRNSKSIMPLLLTLIITLFTYFNTYSRSSLLAYFSFIIFKLIYDKNKKIFNNKIIKKIVIYIPIISVIFTFLAFICYNNNYWIGLKLNKLLSARLYNISYFYQNFSITLLGQDLNLALRTLDTAPAYFLYSFGIVGLIIYVYGFTKLLKTLYKEQNYILLIIFFIFIIYGLSERLWTAIDYNIFISAFTYVFFNNKKDVELK